jgi:MFS family permease
LMVGLFGVLFYIPLFLQQVQGLGALNAGITLLPQALVMAVLMPFAGRVYDRIGPRWPATIGVTIVAVATYMMHSLTIDTSREQIIWWLMFRAVGLGIAMMPIMTAGLAAIPTAQVNAASAFNNVAQRTSAALGLAVLTAIFTTQSAQQMAGRAALLPADTATPHLGGPTVPDWLGVYATYHQTQLLVFVDALDDLLLIAAGLSAVGALGALLLRSGPAPATSAPVPAPQPAPTPAVPADGRPSGTGAARNGAVGNGAVGNGAVESSEAGRDVVPAGAVLDNGGPVRPAEGRPHLGVDARPRDS